MILKKYCEETFIFWKRGMHFNDHFKHLNHFWLRYHDLIFPSACFNIRANSESMSTESALNQDCSALKTQYFRAKKNSAEFFSSEQRWFKENQSWSALKQSWSALMFFMFSESALLRADYLWDFNPGKSSIQTICLNWPPGMA